MLLFPLAEHTETSFSWTIQPPLTAAFLGGSYWAALVLIGWSAAQGRWILARAALAPVLLIAVMLLAATLIHVDRFDMDSLAGPFWLVVYCLVPPALLLLVWRQLREPGSDGERGRPLSMPLRALLGVQGIVMLGVGVALFASPASTADDLWPWMLTPLTARAVGAFATGFGIAALLASVEGDRERYRGAALAYLALGLLSSSRWRSAATASAATMRATRLLGVPGDGGVGGRLGRVRARPSASRAASGSS